MEKSQNNHSQHSDDLEVEQRSLTDKLHELQSKTNFSQEQIKIRDDLIVNVFANHKRINQNGKVIEKANHESEEQKFESGSDDSEEEEDEQIDAEKDDEEDTQVTNKFTVNLIAQYPNQSEDLVLHWGMSRKQVGEWGPPDEKFFPIETKRFTDGKACQTKFVKDTLHPDFREIQMNVSWFHDLEPPVKSISYVLHEPKRNAWHNNGGRDYHVKFALEPEHPHRGKHFPFGKIGDVVAEIIECETVYGSWTLMHRYGRCKDMLNNRIESDNRDHVFTKQLTWQKNYNTKPKDLQGAQVSLTDEICGQFAKIRERTKGSFLNSGDFLRYMLGFIGKGAGNGQRVRDEILNIMHRHKISESAGHFYEQWHQKLHNNTTPDDIAICEALLAYLRTGGNMSKYWEVLQQNGISKERLASYERKITFEPYYRPETINNFEEYLSILKQMHSSGDLQILTNEARQHVGNDTKGMMDDLMKNYNDHDTLRQMERVSSLRFNLAQNHMDLGNIRKLKDVLFLDLALESYLRGLTEKIIHIDIGFEAYIREAAIILSNLTLSYSWDELNACKEDWDKLVQPICKNMDEDNARKLKSVVDRVKQSLGEVTDQYNDVVQSKAELLGKEFKVEEYAYKIFAEELIRGTLFFSLSMILKKIDPHIRECAHLGDWLVISQGRSHGSRGYVEKVKHLHEVMHHTYERRTILLCERIDGEEEVPNNVQAIVLINGTDYPDVLAHVSVRARNLKVMFTVCFDDNKIKQLEALVGRHAFMTTENHAVRFQEKSPNEPITRRASSSLILQNIIDNAKNVKAPPEFPKAFMQIDEFNTKNMGAKSNNLKILKGGIDKWIQLPQSGCIPFQMMEYTLKLQPDIQQELEIHINKLNNIKSVTRMNRTLLKCKDLIMQLKFNPNDQNHVFLKDSLIQFGIAKNDLEKAWETIKMVWASKFNERAFLATKKIGVSLHSVYMAVLVQRVIPAEYAYVIHTSNPTNGEDEEVYVESCLGMGEALVSTMPGQAFSFTFHKSTQKSDVNAYPNKPLGLKADGFIFRSDSNSEDLPGFAGAGLFDSYPMMGTKEFRIRYNKERLITDKQFRENFMNNVGRIGMEIEALYGESQDIEGVFYNNKFHVVQTRPQV